MGQKLPSVPHSARDFNMAEYQTSQVHVQRFILKKSIATIILLETLEEDGKIEIIRGKTRGWIRRREEKGYFNNIEQKLIIVTRMRFSIVIMIQSVLVPKQCGFQKSGDTTLSFWPQQLSFWQRHVSRFVQRTPLWLRIFWNYGITPSSVQEYHLLFSNYTAVIVGEMSGNVLLLLNGLIIIETKQFIFSRNVPQLAALKLVNLKNCDKKKTSAILPQTWWLLLKGEINLISLWGDSLPLLDLKLLHDAQEQLLLNKTSSNAE